MATNKTISSREKKTMKRPTNAKMRITKKVTSQTMKMRSKWITTCNSTQSCFWPSISQRSEGNRCNRGSRPTTIRSTKKTTRTEPPTSLGTVALVTLLTEVSRTLKPGPTSKMTKPTSLRRALHFCKVRESICTGTSLWMVTKEQIYPQLRPLEATQVDQQAWTSVLAWASTSQELSVTAE